MLWTCLELRAGELTEYSHKQAQNAKKQKDV